MNRRRMFAAACALIGALAAATAAPAAADLGRAPDLTLSDLKGAKVRLDYNAGKLTLVNFWAVWCGPCREEMPQIAKLFARFGGQGFRAVGIAVQSGEPADVKAFLDHNKDYGINYPILLGDDDTLEKFGDVQAVPTTFLIDPGGRVVKRFLGVTPGFSAKLETEIRRTLSPPPDKTKP